MTRKHGEIKQIN